MMGPEKPAQIICHLLELLKDSRRLPVPPGCPMEVRSPPQHSGVPALPIPLNGPVLSAGVCDDAELLGVRPQCQTHLHRVGSQG